MNDRDLTRPRSNHGRNFPVWLDTAHPEARRGTQIIRGAEDPNLIVGLDTRRHVFQIWGPSLDVGGWIPLCDCQDDRGRPFRAPVPWEVITAAIRAEWDDAEHGIYVVDRVRERNEARLAGQERDQRRETEEAAGYFAAAIGQELDGALRHSAKDVALGYQLARDGRSKGTQRPGQVVSLPTPPKEEAPCSLHS